MNRHTIGVDVDDFRLPTKDALRKAAELSLHAVELATVAGDVMPSSLSSSGRRHLSRYVDGLGLRMAVLVADLPGLRLTDSRTVDERVERTCEILELAADLRVPVVTAAAGALTHPETGEPSPTGLAALERIGEWADVRGVVYALRPSYDTSERLVDVLDKLRCPSIRVCLDPAAMVMTGANPMSVIERFPDQIALMHARDAAAGLAERAGRETRLGEGEVDLIGILAALSAAEYTGPYILRRTDSQNPTADIENARDVLRRLLPPG
ncbi:MAG: sugar phosphate isomerase/epimerase family protein [Phycisphaerae bacterium]